jgi:hypothetical protein
MPLDDDSEDRQLPSLSFLIKTSFKNYEIAITKYENLLVENTTLTTLIKSKLSQLPIESEVRSILSDLVEKTDQRVKHQQDRLDDTEIENKSSTESLIRTLDGHVKDLLFNLKLIMAWLTIVSIVGTTVVGYIKYVTDNTSKNKITLEHPVDSKSYQPHVDYLDRDGNKIVVPVPTPDVFGDHK